MKFDGYRTDLFHFIIISIIILLITVHNDAAAYSEIALILNNMQKRSTRPVIVTNIVEVTKCGKG